MRESFLGDCSYTLEPVEWQVHQVLTGSHQNTKAQKRTKAKTSKGLNSEHWALGKSQQALDKDKNGAQRIPGRSDSDISVLIFVQAYFRNGFEKHISGKYDLAESEFKIWPKLWSGLEVNNFFPSAREEPPINLKSSISQNGSGSVQKAAATKTRLHLENSDRRIKCQNMNWINSGNRMNKRFVGQAAPYTIEVSYI